MPATDAARALHGSLALRFAAGPAGTALAEARRTPPMQVQRLLRLHPASPRLVTAILLNETAGIFAGDRLRLEILVERDAAASIATPSATRVFAMPAGHAEIEAHVRVAAGGYLEYLPEPTVLCRDAALQQRTVLEAEQGGLLAYGEVIAFGREAFGERHAYRSFDLCTELHAAGTPVLVEALRLGSCCGAEAPGLLDRYAAHGSLLLVCAVGDEQRLLDAVRCAINGTAGLTTGASLLDGVAGLAVRALGPSAHQVASLLKGLVDVHRRLACSGGSCAGAGSLE